MTAEDFRAWLAEMQSKGLARSDAECGRIIGRTANMVQVYKAKGANLTVALACNAVVKGIGPFLAPESSKE